MYISAQMEDPAKFMIDIGTGYFVEMSNEQAADYFKRKQQYLKKQVFIFHSYFSAFILDYYRYFYIFWFTNCYKKFFPLFLKNVISLTFN